MNAPLLLKPAKAPTVADLIRDLGDIPPERIRLDPPIGTATIADLERPDAKGCELVEGTLVEKAVGLLESLMGVFLSGLIDAHVRPKNLGIVVGEEAGMEILTGIVRKPDVAFISWDRFPGRRLTKEAYPAIVPDLAVEVISEGNTPREMQRKRGEYFKAGVRLVWEVDRFEDEVRVYTGRRKPRVLREGDVLTGKPVLPDFSVAVGDIFGQLERHG